MADPTMTTTLRGEETRPVYDRVSWGALLAGLAVTLAVFILLTSLGVAVGLSVTGPQSDGGNIALGFGIWGLITALLAFFTGGCVTSRFTVGESRAEAMMYGAVLWGASVAVLIWMAGGAVRTGFAASLRAAEVMTADSSSSAAAGGIARADTWEEAARRADLSEEQIEQIRAELPTAARARSVSMQTAWWSFAALLASLLACIGGSMYGTGAFTSSGQINIRRETVPLGR